jgi:acetyl-CoA acetyltransferase
MTFPEVAIVGVHRTQQAKTIERGALSLCLEAGLAALEDAGLELSDVDGLAARWDGPGGTVMHPGSADWASLLRLPLRWIDDSYPSGVPFLLNAGAAIGAGLCHTVLMMGGQTGSNRPGGLTPRYTRPDNEFTGPFGSFTAAQFALVARRYYDKYQPDVEKIAGVAAAIRNLGSANPNAVMTGRGRLTAADVLASPMVADPFHLLELCLSNDGAVAVVVTSLERARNCRNRPIRVLGGGAEWYRQQYVDWPRYEEVGRIGSTTASRALAETGLSIADVDVLELYEANAFEVVRQLEVLGYCDEGEGVDFVSDRGIGIDKGLAINTDGGLLAYSHCGRAAPTLKIAEAVDQLRGRAAGRQVQDANIALTTGAGSGAQYFNLAILARD